MDNHLEEMYKETIEELKSQYEISKYAVKYLEEKLAAAKESEIAKKEEYNKKQMANLEKERNFWKIFAEKMQDRNVIIAHERKILQYEKEEWMEKAKLAADRQETFKMLLGQIEKLASENDIQKQQLSKHNNEMEEQKEKWQKELKAEKDNAQFLTMENEAMLKANDYLIEKRDQLQRELDFTTMDALASCKICFDTPVQTVFLCGHAACNECFKNLQECHICREWIGSDVKKIYFT